MQRVGVVGGVRVMQVPQLDLVVLPGPAHSLRLVANWLCEYARQQGLSCDVMDVRTWQIRRYAMRVRRVVMVGIPEFHTSGIHIYYFPVDGLPSQKMGSRIQMACRYARCVVPSNYSKQWLEAIGVNADVVPHGIKWEVPVEEAVSRSRSYDVVYANFAFPHSCCDRKGWVWFFAVRDILGVRGLSISTPFLQQNYPASLVGDFIDITRLSMREWEGLVSSAKLWVNTSWGGGYEMGPILAAGLGLGVVAWDLPLFREVLGKLTSVGCASLAATYAYHLSDYTVLDWFRLPYAALDVRDMAEKARQLLGRWGEGFARMCAMSARRMYGLHLYQPLIEMIR